MEVFSLQNGRPVVVLLAGFIGHAICNGMIWSFGVYFVILSDVFERSKGELALIGSVAYGAMMLAGPLGALLFKKIHSRPTVMSGGILAASGYVASMLVPNFFALVVAQAIVGSFT